MKKKVLPAVKQLIKQLSAADRQALIPFLGELPDSGLQSYDLREELAVLKKHGTRLAAPDDNPDRYLVNLVFVRNLVAVQIRDTEILRAVFFPDNFTEAFPKTKRQIYILSAKFKEMFTEENRNAERATRRTHGIEETDEEYEEDVIKRCNAAAELWMTEKAKRIAEQISLHLPGMVGDMMAAAIKGETFYDLHKAFQELSPDKKPLALKDFKRAVLETTWREVKPHLPSTKHVRTHPNWRGEDTLKQYAQLVNDRRSLATCIKDMYEDCDNAPGWMEDLKDDSTFQRLSLGVAQRVIAWAMKRIAIDGLPSREQEPLSIACEMARRELELPEQNVETLRNYYADGNKLVKARRNERSS